MPETFLIAYSSAPSGDSSAALDLLIILAAAALVTTLLRRLRLAAIPGYLITGAIIGPFALGLISSDESIEQIKSLSTVLLMFIIGLHLDLSSIRSGLVSMLTAGAVSTVLVVLALWPAGWFLSATPPEALAVAMAMSMSSTAVGIRVLQQRREMHRLHGRLVVGISIVQDLLSLVVLAVLPALGTWAASYRPGEAVTSAPTKLVANPLDSTLTAWVRDQTGLMAGSAAGYITAGVVAFGGIVALIAFGRYLLPRMLGEAAREQSGETSLVLSAAVALGAAVLTAWLGFSPELGAFIAGFMLASTPFRYQLAGQLAPLRDLLMAIFFTTVGLKLNMGVVLGSWWVVLLGVGAVVLSKSVLIGVSVWGAGATPVVAGRTGLALANAGEFSLVILALAEVARVTSSQTNAVAIAVVVVSLVVAPALFTLSDRLAPQLGRLPTARWIKRSTLREGPEPAPAAHAEATGEANPRSEPAAPAAPAPKRVVIAGYGVVGRAVSDHLEVNGVPYTIVELNSETVMNQQRLGRRAVYGDIGNPAVLEALHIEHCEAVILTVPDDDAILRACTTIRNLAPHVFIVARTNYLSAAFAATGAGADDVSIGEVAVAEDMVKRVLRRLGQRKD